jgi:prepilin-type N-terminal cleavage/methylation domain-containing protein
MKKDKKAFTLIELMVAMGVVAVLVTMSVVGIQIVQRSLRNTQRRDILNTFNLYLTGFSNDNGRFPLANEVSFKDNGNGTGSILVNNVEVTELKGPTIPQATTDQGGTAYCYISEDGSTYALAVTVEGGDPWSLQLGNSGVDCTTAVTPI